MCERGRETPGRLVLGGNKDKKRIKMLNTNTTVDLLEKNEVVKSDFLSLAQTQSHDGHLVKSIKLKKINCN